MWALGVRLAAGGAVGRAQTMTERVRAWIERQRSRTALYPLAYGAGLLMAAGEREAVGCRSEGGGSGERSGHG